MPDAGPSGLRLGLLRAGLLGVLVLAAIGLRAGSPLLADSTRWRFDDVLHTGIALQVAAVVIGVAVLVVVALSARGVGGSPTPRPRRRVWLSLLVFAGFVLVSVAVNRLSKAAPGQSAAPVAPQPVPGGGHGAPAYQGAIAPVAVLALLAVIAVLAAAVAARRRSAGPISPDEPAPPAYAEGLAAAARVLRFRATDEPRARVLAAYAAFEQTLAAQGLTRGPSGTATALLVRAVEAGASAEPARELTELFGAARFGSAPVTERDVARAQQALDVLLSRA